ncbi:hypothetical protein A9Q84_17680 [Halobacteriovorax marinus]|uniref:Uncharacterized protein n=1 Tax=Halobacteriovorax marinus TaxID=97084 RepID=A0A1Y5F374_9BACT|nr:hypothetical protein A9Q84_17680 [Halobacteriovorax marinus]
MSNHILSKKHQAWLDLYLDNCKKLNKSTYTLINYRCDLEKFLTWYEFKFNSTIEKSKKNFVSEYKSFLVDGGEISKQKKGRIITLFIKIFLRFLVKEKSLPLVQTPLAVSSVKRHLSSIKNFFEYLKQGHEDHSKLFLINPVKNKIHAIKLKEKDIKHTVMLPKDQWRDLIENTYRTKEKTILLLLYWGGFRLSELTQLRFSNFDFKKKVISLERKGGYIHTFRPQQEDAIFKNILYMREHIVTSGDFLFINHQGNCLSTRSMYNLIKKLLQRNLCDSDLGPHSFRKACATNLYEKTKDLLLVRDYLNHHDAKVTQTYIETKHLSIY